MSCKQENKRYSNIERIRTLAKNAAKLEHSVFVVFERPDGSFGFVKDGEEYKGKLIEYVYW